MNSQNESVRVPATEVQEIPVFVIPAYSQALKDVYGFWIFNRNSIVLVLVKVLDTGLAHIHDDWGKGPVGVRA